LDSGGETNLKVKYSIPFIIIVLILGFFIGSVVGSLVQQVFGLEFLNRTFFDKPLKLAENFYMIKSLEINITPSGILGLILSSWFVYRKGKE